MANKKNPLLINIESLYHEQDKDIEELERVTHSLHNDLNELDVVEKIDLVNKNGEAPAGSKGGDIVSWGSLLVTLATSGTSILPSFLQTLQSWLTRHERHKITIEIADDKLEVTGASDKEQERLINAWINRHKNIQKS